MTPRAAQLGPSSGIGPAQRAIRRSGTRKSGQRACRHPAGMPARHAAVDRGRVRGEELVRRFARELREAQISRGLSQREVAAAVGIPRSTVGRIETCRTLNASVRLACMLGAAVGLDVSLGIYPGSNHLRDAGQMRVMHRFAAKLGDMWRWRHEVELRISHDQRAWDAEGVHKVTGLRLTVEVETRMHDMQAVLRRLALKRRDGDVDRLILVVADTRVNRMAIELARDMIASAFPCSARRALAYLAVGEDPGADALIML